MQIDITNLPVDVLSNVLSFVSDRQHLGLVSKQFYSAMSILDDKKLVISVSDQQLVSNFVIF
jgi:hypothetical protein